MFHEGASWFYVFFYKCSWVLSFYSKSTRSAYLKLSSIQIFKKKNSVKLFISRLEFCTIILVYKIHKCWKLEVYFFYK